MHWTLCLFWNLKFSKINFKLRLITWFAIIQSTCRAPNNRSNVPSTLRGDETEEELVKVPYKADIQWGNVAVNLFIHLGFFVGFYYLITGKLMAQTYAYCKEKIYTQSFHFLNKLSFSPQSLSSPLSVIYR